MFPTLCPGFSYDFCLVAHHVAVDFAAARIVAEFTAAVFGVFADAGVVACFLGQPTALAEDEFILVISFVGVAFSGLEKSKKALFVRGLKDDGLEWENSEKGAGIFEYPNHFFQRGKLSIFSFLGLCCISAVSPTF